MEQSNNTYGNFKLTAALCRLFAQFPVIHMESLTTIEFKITSIVALVSLTIYTYEVYYFMQSIGKGWFHYIYKFFGVNMLFIYYANCFKYKKIINFLKEMKLFDDEAQPLLNIRTLYSNQCQKYYWLACSILSVSYPILVIFLLTLVNMQKFRKFDFLRVYGRSPLYLHGVNYICMLYELKARLHLLRQSLKVRLSKMEKYPRDVMNHLIIEKYRFLHIRAANCLALFIDSFSIILPAEFYISGLAILLNIFGIFFWFNTEMLIKSIISVIYDTVCIFCLIHQSSKIGREGLKFIEDIYQIKVNHFHSQARQQIDVFIKQMKLRPFIITSFGVNISSWSVYAAYTSLVATYIIAASQLSSQILNFLTSITN